MINRPLALDSEASEAFLELAQACTAGCGNVQAFRDLVRHSVKPLLPHRCCIAVLGSLVFDQLSMRNVIGVDYPDEWIALLPKELNIHERPVVATWLATREPIIIDPVRDRHLLSSRELHEIEAFALGRLAIHGQIDVSTRMGSYFSFAGTPPEEPEERLKFHLRLIAPHLHAALMSVPAVHAADQADLSLTAVERELLHWVAAGRSNAQIAILRGRSKATVRNQLHALYQKLGVANRAEAVTVAGRFALPWPAD